MSLTGVDPQTVDFPHASTALWVGGYRQVGNKEQEKLNRYFVSSCPPDSKRPEAWLQATRDHWGGVEIRNHWRKDACLREDGTRSRNPQIVGSLIMLRGLILHFYAQKGEGHPNLPSFIEANAADSRLTFSMICGS